MSEFRGRVAVVTGAGSGIGRALALELASRGARLALSDVDSVGLAATVAAVEQRGGEVRSDHLDVSERGSVLDYAEIVRRHFGVVNQIYNNAGIAFHGDVEKTEFKDLERVIDVDFWGVVNGTKAFLPHLVESGDGHVVNVSSLFGLLSIPSQSAYNAAKFAVRGFTEALRQEMLIARHPVHVTCVHPGGIKTAIARNATVAEGQDQKSVAEFFDRRLAKTTPEQAALVILRGVEKNKARVLIGNDARALDALARITGSRYQDIIVRLSSRVLPRTTTQR
ncbi:SDR family NAD(P)-dependent oxidoreductase [Rhodococcus sp. BP-149]|uniref:SDR family NAD(P)-dependent oxidoreductase n=1 Tax=unclassified Rhodococcus (in: high G+C Gram-positive bacteria) TaxID=192944 RepID=UPI001C9AFB35|nr:MULTISPECIES: SDR family NAD(P)-dependent oxidoreductase [unclassified Rhodococcus (in: high G+C Gram-positive bacteria)]MBY6684084.1 SDR family NAD(P)-dependent oxidoreductase [Rhodococcus sp. BP-288]MBY6693255.1 SDR family NAD(P)-dependent oxidoreductase [Rhodococcus sp. BP-188]MBY6697452.1 SDR family NAD(P)-dependent oxidoreductase [Rhodococcus sp. BP-285]MBY6702129.1 SDR family NAD(P)-dependent oxidoreductase [Rhodococcus sp. BP-283]MBY6709938.1 SDR family NAD(P)-dependent oxidoreductas